MEVDLILGRNDTIYLVEIKSIGIHADLEFRWPLRQRKRFLRLAQSLGETHFLRVNALFATVNWANKIEVFQGDELLG